MTDEQFKHLDARLKQIIALIGVQISAQSPEAQSPTWYDEAVKAIKGIIEEVDDLP
jgi:hypothetical protein